MNNTKASASATAFDILSDLIAESKSLAKSESAKKAQSKAEADKSRKLARERAKYLPVTVALEDKAWEAQFQTIQIVQQTCDECLDTIEYVGAIHIHEKHKRLPAWREVPAPSNSQLPLQIRYHPMRVPMCACCLRVVDILDQHFSDNVSTQMELF